jgi:hypothetical protein
MILAIIADVLQIVVFPLFVEGALSPAEDLLAVCPNVGQEEIAESNAFDARLNSILALLFHDALVVCI